MRELIDKYRNDRLLGRKMLLMFIGVSIMGFSLSFLREANLGTDPYTFMNLTLSGRMKILFGTWQLFLNLLILVIGWFWNKKLIGPGTIYNMVGIGYISDFFCYIWDKTIPREVFIDFPSRAIVFAIALFVFAIAAAIYMNSDCGLSPYDLFCFQVGHSVKNVPFFLMRMICDFSAIFIGFLAGTRPSIGTICIALALGPAISIVGRAMKKFVLPEN